MSYLRYMCLFGYSGGEHILCCVFCNVFPHHGYPMLPVFFFLDCPFLITHSVFFNICSVITFTSHDRTCMFSCKGC